MEIRIVATKAYTGLVVRQSNENQAVRKAS